MKDLPIDPALRTHRPHRVDGVELSLRPEAQPA